MRRRTMVVLAAVAAAAAVLGTVGIGGSSAQTRRVAINMSEFDFRGPARLGEAGRKTITVRNRGQFPHNFTVIRGPRRFASATLEGGRSARVTRTLPAGAYLAICTVRDGGHMADGMVHTFTVGTQDPATGVWR